MKRDVEEDAALLRALLRRDVGRRAGPDRETLPRRRASVRTAAGGGNGLIEDYWRGRLSPAARERFEDATLLRPAARAAALIREAIEHESRPATPLPTRSRQTESVHAQRAQRVGPAVGWIFRSRARPPTAAVAHAPAHSPDKNALGSCDSIDARPRPAGPRRSFASDPPGGAVRSRIRRSSVRAMFQSRAVQDTPKHNVVATGYALTPAVEICHHQGSRGVHAARPS